MKEFRQVGDAAIEAVTRALMKAAAEAPSRKRARQIREMVAELQATPRQRDAA